MNAKLRPLLTLIVLSASAGVLLGRAAVVAVAAPAFTAAADITPADRAAGHITAADRTAGGPMAADRTADTAVQPTSATSARLR